MSSMHIPPNQELPGPNPEAPLTQHDLASLIDHTLLKPEATRSDIERLCHEAIEFAFHSVCVNPAWVSLCSSILSKKNVEVCTVIGFPLGTTSSESKCFEARKAISDGATEIDMVMNVGALKSGDLIKVQEDIAMVADQCHIHGIELKVIIETGLLTDDEKRIAARLCEAGGADFVKTCTGFSVGKATVEDVLLLRSELSDRVRIKASGGISTSEIALALTRAGADRLGTSGGIKLVTGGEADGY